MNIGYGFGGVATNTNPFEIASYARANGVNLFFAGLVDHRDDFTLDQYLCNGQPPLLYVGNPHWVFSTGQTTVNGIATYSDIDPDDYPNGSTLEGFNYSYGAIALYNDISGPLSGLYVKAHSPIELLLTAPNGQQTGFNPLTNTRFNSIPAGGYVNLFLADDKDHTLPPTPQEKTLVVVGPGDGSYTLQAIGTGTGVYTLDFFAYDANGSVSTAEVTGNTTLGQILAYGIGYSSVPGSQITVTPLVTSFSALSAKLDIWAGPPPRFDLNSSFTLGSGTNGINPLTEKVTFSIGTFSITVPAGSFKKNAKGQFVFQGIINGVALQLQITPLGGKSYQFKADGTAVNLTGLTNPVTVIITIGDDSGTTAVTADFQ